MGINGLAVSPHSWGSGRSESAAVTLIRTGQLASRTRYPRIWKAHVPGVKPRDGILGSMSKVKFLPSYIGKDVELALSSIKDPISALSIFSKVACVTLLTRAVIQGVTSIVRQLDRPWARKIGSSFVSLQGRHLGLMHHNSLHPSKEGIGVLGCGCIRKKVLATFFV